MKMKIYRNRSIDVALFSNGITRMDNDLLYKDKETGEVVRMVNYYPVDLHTETAKQFFQKDNISEEERSFAQNLNFCKLYGRGVKS